ncbi:MAG: ornithine carbamoyltransferase [Alphaproteobacteria bacterium]|nr:ornithine carbamoyltransferase [Alphaproteobacteria bacterium]MBU0799150.1 ornithine carbamoyltransferase [Alphaproteobacteria bacterium]MBU0888821.1 ornithine carbamoyltransferase [Alphaproteobacteria bacterium]MBU1813841.1 ornithine carbamoyltransferase [Alphaproteobacteria bacterium]
MNKLVKQPKHFLDLDLLDTDTLRHILDSGRTMKDALKAGEAGEKPLAGKTLAMIFEKPSTRTRVSFEVGMKQLGGETVLLNTADIQSSRGETMADTARVLSRYVDAIMIRTFSPAILQELADNATVPVINGLTDRSHPCQIMADVLTFEEHRGPIKGKVVAWSGDGNNVAASWIHAAARFDFELRIACPETLTPDEGLVAWARGQGARIVITHDAEAAVAGADCVVTDTWVSMGDGDTGSRHNMLQPFQVNERLMRHAKPDAIFMHCLPAHRGEEVSAAVIDGPQSVVWDEAENRLHSQKGVLVWCLS